MAQEVADSLSKDLWKAGFCEVIEWVGEGYMVEYTCPLPIPHQITLFICLLRHAVDQPAR